MDSVARSRALESEGRRLLAVASSNYDAAVPSCPGWSVRDLVTHVGNVWQHIDAAFHNNSPEAPDLSGSAPPPEADEGLESWAGQRLDHLVATVAAADPATPRWTWAGDNRDGFWQRRAHLEALVHRVDAELAANDRSPVDAAAAIDGIDELFSVLAPALSRERPTGSFHLHQSDGDGEFMLSVVDDALVVTHEHGKGDAALRGGAEDLWLVAWRRGTMDDMEFFGDRSVADSWIGLAP